MQRNRWPRILTRDTSNAGDVMTILRLIAKILEVFHFRPAKSGEFRKFTFAELQELAERDDFDQILKEARLPGMPILKGFEKKWNRGKGLDASKFDAAAYKKFQREVFQKKQRYKGLLYWGRHQADGIDEGQYESNFCRL